MKPAALVLCALLAAVVAAAPGAAQTGANVLVVVNESAPESLDVGEHYARARSVPGDQVLRVTVDAKEAIDRATFERAIEGPIAAWLARNVAHDRILYIVLAKGVPVRVAGTDGRAGTSASVDSELTLLYRRLTGQAAPPQGAVANPYFLGDRPLAEARPFSHADQDLFLVTRLDGFSAADAKALVDRCVSTKAEGRIVLDMKAATDDVGNRWLAAAAERLAGLGWADRTVLEKTGDVARGEADVVGYYSWGSNDPAASERTTGLRFAPGAVGGTYVGSSARTFQEPPASWRPGRRGTRDGAFAGTVDALAGDLVREGLAGVAAYVGDPFLDRSVRPDILLPAYVSGFSLAEAFYLATPALGWQGVVLGDPLCRPFGASTLTPAQLDPGLDPVTEVPRAFSRRWVDAAAAKATGSPPSPEALALVLKARARLVKADVPGARGALEEATALDPRLGAAQFELASLYEVAGEFDKAADRYRVILGYNNKDVLALNNLAYHLATRAGKPGDALPLAEQAYYLSRGEPNVTDTLAWIHHLLGHPDEARRFMGEALRRSPNNGDLRFHAAAILEAAGRRDEARAELKRALDLDPSLAGRDEVKALQAKLGQP